MKKLFLTLALCMIAITGFSQILSDIRWDVKFGMNISNQTKLDDSKALVGITMGVGADYSFTENWAFQPGLMLTTKGFKYNIYKCRPLYLDIPLLGAYRFDIARDMKFVVNMGPYLAIGLGGKYKYHGDSYKIFKDGWKRFDFGLQWGVGIEWMEHYLANITVQHGFITPYDYGKNYHGSKAKNFCFAIGVGYRF